MSRTSISWRDRPQESVGVLWRTGSRRHRSIHSRQEVTSWICADLSTCSASVRTPAVNASAYSEGCVVNVSDLS